MGEEHQRHEVSGAGRRRFTTGRIALSVTGLVVAIVTFVLWLRAPGDPLYKGKRLSAYIYETVPTIPRGPLTATQRRAIENEHSRTLAEAKAAVTALGPRALPLIRHWLESRSELRRKLREAAAKPGSRLQWLLRYRWISTEPQYFGFIAASMIPGHVVSLLPIFHDMVLSDDLPTALNAANLFEAILNAVSPGEASRLAHSNADLVGVISGGGAKPLNAATAQVLGALVRYDPPSEAESVVRRLFPFRAQRFSSVDTTISRLDPDGFILNLLYLESGTPDEKPAAALYFKDRLRSPERVVPLLTSNLTSAASANLLQSVCDALAAYGTNATPALPQLTNLLTHPRPAVREAAKSAVERIWGESRVR